MNNRAFRFRLDRRIMSSAILIFLFAKNYGWSAQAGHSPQRTVQAKPEVTLIVTPTNLTVERRDGAISFRVDAAASEGFSGTVSGTLTVAQPSNPSGVVLTKGYESKTFPFVLAAGQKTSDTSPPQTGTFMIRTSPTNPTSGTLTYTITVDSSAGFTARNSDFQLKVKTNPL